MKPIFALLIVPLFLVSCTDYYDETRVDYRDRMTGSYEVEEYSDTFDEYVYYDMYVSKDHGSRNRIYFEDFYADGLDVHAYIDGEHITIPFQVDEGFEVEGHGTYYRGQFRLHYTVRDRYSNSPADYCETVAYRD